MIPQTREKGLGNHQITHGRWPKCAARGKVEPSLAKAFRRAFEGFREWDLVRLPKQPLFWLWIDEDSKILLRENVLQYNSIVYIYIWLYDYTYDYMIIYIYMSVWSYIYMIIYTCLGWFTICNLCNLYVVCSVYIFYTYYITEKTKKKPFVFAFVSRWSWDRRFYPISAKLRTHLCIFLLLVFDVL